MGKVVDFGGTVGPGISSPEYSGDAWGRNKSVIDKSILHGMFTYNVPVGMWKELLNDVEQPSFSAAASVNGELVLTSTGVSGEAVRLSTFRNPRYEPNRGHMYSSSIFLDSKEALGTRRFGYFTPVCGAFFELRDGNLYAVVRTTVDGVTEDDRYLITADVDIEKGNVYDIQMMWRGVGNYTFYINLKPVFRIEYLGMLDELSTFNPANPISFECINGGDVVSLRCGCVDITTEGGNETGNTYGSVCISNNSGQTSVSGYNQPVLAIRSKLLVDDKLNTRDTLALLASAYSDNNSIFRVWATRDFTAITDNDQVWEDFGDGHLEYTSYNIPPVTTPMEFDTTKAFLIFSCRVAQDETYSTSALFEGRADIYLTPGDMFVFTMHRENGNAAIVGTTFEFAEQI